jgi:hypothetical protein
VFFGEAKGWLTNGKASQSNADMFPCLAKSVTTIC